MITAVAKVDRELSGQRPIVSPKIKIRAPRSWGVTGAAMFSIARCEAGSGIHLRIRLRSGVARWIEPFWFEFDPLLLLHGEV